MRIYWLALLTALLAAPLMSPQQASAEDRDLTKVAEWTRLKGKPNQTLPEPLANALGLTARSVKRFAVRNSDTDVVYAFDAFYDDQHLVMTRRTKDFGVLWRLSSTGNIEKCIIFTSSRTVTVVSNEQYSIEFEDARKTLGDYVESHR